MDLPNSERLNIAGLSSSFKNVTNSYKFFWFWAILDDFKENQQTFITYEDLSMRMVSLVWYPLDYYKLSFGKQDSFKLIAGKISGYFTVDNSVNSEPLLKQIWNNVNKNDTSKITKEVTDTLKRYVSYRFLSSFFANQIRGVKDSLINGIIKDLSNETAISESVPYKIEDHGIRLNDRWASYFQEHHNILKAFIKWHVLQYLQKHNPYTIGLTEKLEKPTLRDLKIAKTFWMTYMAETITYCIYSGAIITKSNLSLDHFIPWSYVAHDRLWNIVPTTQKVNSAKSDLLPSLEHYFDSYGDLQFSAMRFHLKNGFGQYQEEINELINVKELANLSAGEFKNRLLPEIENNIRTAKNLGFQHPFIYKSETL